MYRIANLKAGPSFGPTNPTFTTHTSSQDSHPPNALAVWGSVAPRMPRVIVPSFQERTDVFYTGSITYPPYPCTSSCETPRATAHQFTYHDMSRPALSHPPGRMANTGRYNSSSCVLEKMDRQSLSETTDRSRSGQPMGPSSAFWGGDGRTPITLDRGDHGSLGSMLSNPPEHAPSHRSSNGISEQGEIILGQGTTDISPTAYYQAAMVAVSPLPPLTPISWRRIPQQRYIPKTRDRSFLQQHRITFNLDGVPGFNLQRALNRVFVGLDGRDDPVLENANGPVSCRLLFPGYPTDTRCTQIAVKNWKKPPAPIMRSKLAYETAKRVSQYLDALATTTMDPSVDPQWKIGQGCMKLEKMYLVSISWVAKGSVQPEIWVDTDCSWFGSTETEL